MINLNLSEKTTAELIVMYNDKAFMLDRPAVKRFADRATAEKRVLQIYSATAGVAAASKPVSEAAPEVKEEPKTEAKPVKEPKAKKTAKPKVEGELVREGSFRDKLLTKLQSKIGSQVSISDLMTAVYGESRKDYKGPLMMVMKGLRGVLKANDIGEIRKTRENKENCFGLYIK